jgi:hypothetical protein
MVDEGAIEATITEALQRGMKDLGLGGGLPDLGTSSGPLSRLHTTGRTFYCEGQHMSDEGTTDPDGTIEPSGDDKAAPHPCVVTHQPGRYCYRCGVTGADSPS